jgi:tubulin beta
MKSDGSGSEIEGQACLLQCTVGVAQIMQKVSEEFCGLYRKNAFLHQYTSSGMDPMEFTEAESNLNDMLSEYSLGNGCFIYEDYDMEDYGEEEAS